MPRKVNAGLLSATNASPVDRYELALCDEIAANISHAHSGHPKKPTTDITSGGINFSIIKKGIIESIEAAKNRAGILQSKYDHNE